MNNKNIIVLIIVLLVIGAGIYFFTPKPISAPTIPATNSTTSNSTIPTPEPTPVSTPVPVSAPTPIIHNVSIAGFAFSPSSITVKKGDTIVWMNKDSAPHTVTGGNLNSPTLSQNKTYSFVFDKTGTFSYHCSIHPSMTGTVTVTD